MLFETNKEKGNAGLAMAIAYFGTHGYNVCLPLNDTQDFDLIVEKDGIMQRVQCKATSQRTPYNVTTVDLRSTGGTKGSVYKTLIETNIELLFVINESKEIWLIPKSSITNIKSLNLGDKYQEFKIEM